MLSRHKTDWQAWLHKNKHSTYEKPTSRSAIEAINLDNFQHGVIKQLPPTTTSRGVLEQFVPIINKQGCNRAINTDKNMQG